MRYKALYRETRPEVFSEILGQDSIVKILKHQVATGTVSHAYLFTGTRGTGKTTTARILAKAVNCEAPDVEGRPCGKCDTCRAIADGTFVDVIEIDAASNNGVDNIRELRESVNYPPAAGRAKVYIIDEVHMLSTGAFNALLKTLEEPPENVIFILATTNPEKLPQTVLSRCMRLDFKRVPQAVLAKHMKDICESRGVEIADDALRLLASNADGSVRDSLSILEQCLSSGEQELTREIVLDFLGAVSEEFYMELTRDVMSGDMSGAFVLIDKALSEGKDVKQIMKDWMGYFRNLLISKYVEDPEDMLNLSAENIQLLKQQSSELKLEDINRAIITLAKAVNDARYSSQARVLLEVAAVSIASGMEYGEATEAPTPHASPAPHASPLPAEAASSAQAEAQVSAAAPAAASVSAEAQAAAPAPSSEVLEDIWRDVCREAAKENPVLSILSRYTPAGQKGDEIKVVVDLEMAKGKIDKNIQYINDLLHRFGASGHLVCVLDDGTTGGQKQTEDDINARLRNTQKAASDFLGVEVQIQK
ncbi:MAG: DNA polymerase III subunit gamma/tau [Eubacterium sp.]|nr:DNA polymerase III subunit gamma/tau [Eubacterium sp.]